MTPAGVAQDFLAETRDLAALVQGMSDEEMDAVTQFKDWTIRDILAHLFHLNQACQASFDGQEAFFAFIGPLMKGMQKGGMQAAHRDWCASMSSAQLVEDWLQSADALAVVAGNADPDAKFPWFGPPMKAVSAMSARQMETWAHGQAVYDLLGEDRRETDRIRNITHLCVITIPFAFKLRKLNAPSFPIEVELMAPSGAIWRWNDDESSCLRSRVTGSAVEFCQVAAQTRAVADTRLKLDGADAVSWSAIAQCFAGAPVDPPSAGSRYKQR